MSGPYVIDPKALYDDKVLCQTLGMRVGSLDRARRSGDLRFTKRGGRVLYLGSWVEEWLTQDAKIAG